MLDTRIPLGLVDDRIERHVARGGEQAGASGLDDLAIEIGKLRSHRAHIGCGVFTDELHRGREGIAEALHEVRVRLQIVLLDHHRGQQDRSHLRGKSVSDLQPLLGGDARVPLEDHADVGALVTHRTHDRARGAFQELDAIGLGIHRSEFLHREGRRGDGVRGVTQAGDLFALEVGERREGSPRRRDDPHPECSAHLGHHGHLPSL